MLSAVQTIKPEVDLTVVQTHFNSQFANIVWLPFLYFSPNILKLNHSKVSHWDQNAELCLAEQFIYVKHQNLILLPGGLFCALHALPVPVFVLSEFSSSPTV